MSTDSSSIIPQIDPSSYTWFLHPIIPGLLLRQGLGPETKWSKQTPESRQMHVTGVITFKIDNLSQSTFFQAAKKAWLRLRFLHPEIVQKSSGEYNEDGSVVMQCEIPQDERVAEDWLLRTFSTGIDLIVKGDAEAMAAVEQEMRKQSVHTNPIAVRLHVLSENPIVTPEDCQQRRASGDSSKYRAAFCFRADHGLTDGMGAYMIAGKYLKLLAEILGSKQEDKKIDWTKAIDRVPKPWVQMLNKQQKLKGPDFEAAVIENTEIVMASRKSTWGLDIYPTSTYYPRSAHHSFSPIQSSSILRSIKEKIGPAYSITHLGHAAMIMTLLRLKHPQSRPINQPDLVSPLFINGRRYLDPLQLNASDHIPLCRAISGIEFRDVGRYILSPNANQGEIQQKLRIACEEARRSYTRIRNQESLLTELFGVTKVMASAKKDVAEKGVAESFFLSDGIVEAYIPRSYHCTVRDTDDTDTTAIEQTAETETKEVIELDDVRFTANPDGAPIIVRMSSFRDAIRLSAEWNDGVYEEETVMALLGGVVELMNAFVDTSKDT